MPAIENQIIQYIVSGIQTGLGMTAAQVYASIVPAYIQGQNPQIIQVVPEQVQNLEEADHGAWPGGCALYRMYFSVYYYLRLQVDQPGASQEMLEINAQGMLDTMQKLRDLFKFTYLGNPQTNANLSIEPVRFESESGTTWTDEDSGVAVRSQTYSCVFGYEQGTTQTM